MLLDAFGPPLKPSAWQFDLFIAPSAFSLTRTYRCAFMPMFGMPVTLPTDLCKILCFWQVSLMVSILVGVGRVLVN